jgi:hypothetical protein
MARRLAPVKTIVIVVALGLAAYGLIRLLLVVLRDVIGTPI